MRNIILYLICIVCINVISSCGGNDKSHSSIPIVKTDTIRTSGFTSTIEYPARILSSQSAALAFKVSGNLSHMYVHKGDRVKKGQLLSSIDDKDYALQLEATRAEYERIKAEASRIISLYKDSVVTAADYDKARYGLEQITAKYHNAQNMLSYTHLYAPYDGYVSSIILDVPSVVGAGMPVLKIESSSRPEIEINIPLSLYNARDKIVSYSATFDGEKDRVALRAINILPSANASQLYAVRLVIPDDITTLPPIGSTAIVHVSLHEKVDNTCKIPSSALWSKEGVSHVWIYSPNGNVTAREVEIDRLDSEGNAIIKKGLSSGEIIITAGVHNLHEGQKVKPMPSPSKTNVGGLL